MTPLTHSRLLYKTETYSRSGLARCILTESVQAATSTLDCTYEAPNLTDYVPQTMLEIEGSRGSIAKEPDETLPVTSEGVLRGENASTSQLP